MSSLVFAEPASQLENRVAGYFTTPLALLFEGYPLPGQGGAVMNSGSLQSSVLLLLPRITYARLVSTCQVTCTGRLEAVTPSAGLWCCLENLRNGHPASALSPGSSSSLDLSQGWRILSKNHTFAGSECHGAGSLQSLLAPSQAGLARGRNSGRRGGTPKLLGAHRHSSSRHSFCTSVLRICSCVHGAVTGPWISWIRAGLDCCFVLFSVTNVATFVQKCPLKSNKRIPSWLEEA